jgi:hypothetical protein
MIVPWPIVTLIDWIVSPFGFDTYVRATGGPGWHWGRMGAERVYFVRRPPGQERHKRLKPSRP